MSFCERFRETRTARCALWAALLYAALLAGCDVDPATELAKAEAGLLADDLRTALIHANALLRAEPDHPAGRLLRGRILLAAGNFSRARDDLRRAAAAGTEATVPLAEALLRVGEPGEALELLQQAPESARGGDYWALSGEALIAVGRLEEAAAALERAAEADPEGTRSLLARARFVSLRGDETEAGRLLDAAVATARTRHRRIDALIARGEHRLRAERFEEAAADLAAAADLSAQDPLGAREVSLLTMLVQLNVARNELAQAGRWARQLAERAPNTLAATYVRALLAYENGRFDEAVEQLQRALGEAPNDSLLATLLGAAHLAKGDVYQAEQELLRALRAAPNDLAASKLLAETRLRQRRPEAALDALEPLAGLNADPQLDALRGIASLQAGEVERGLAYLEQALAGEPANHALRLELARAYMAAGQNERAAALLESVSAADATLTDRLMLMVSQLGAGDREAARQRAEEILQAFPSDARARTAAAAALQLLGDRDRAIELLEEAVNIDGAFVPARLLLAGLLQRAGRANEAERQLQDVLAAEPRHPAALAGLAQLAIARGELAEAEELLDEAVSVAPTVALRVALARVRLRRGDLAGAAEQIEAAEAASPSHPEVTAARGLHALAAGSAEEAVQLLQSAAAALPTRLDVALGLAEAQAAAGDLRGSRDTLRGAAQAAPDWLPVHAALGEVELRLGDTSAALSIAKDLQVRFPQQEPGYWLEAQIRMAQRRYTEAAEYFGLAFDRARSWNVLAAWVTALRLAEQPMRVESALSDWLAEHPGDVPARLVLAEHLQEMPGRTREALAEYERVLAVAPENVVALNNAAWLHHLVSSPEALRLARRARDLAPENPAVLDTLGWILTQQGAAEEGLPHLERAARAAPGEAEIQYHYAYALTRLGRREAARDVLRPVLARPDPFPSRAEAETLMRSL